ncbi:antitoxin protein of toxin-antitoxin system [Diaminobutyricimonas aerilata]|uniref:Antitoxin protein of toxin-antitoxin system n=1 Tax=Diaminobutyricimonas aerilata TaxID=1162967 RepID=A0A2M9CHM5_9MICO|nr:Rv0909 family putative TA system antitoxin [Diaminobutyricimonas aerilata]PJJ71372.1 antitoxin protein of toxin-antitoxin system [Diaminobutyricimonas aerilata]
MAFGDITKKAQQLLRDERVAKALKSEKAEGVSDKLLDGVAGAANKVTGGKHADKIDGARDAADKRIGDR